MTKLYLITGFLGAGKTSFLHHLIPLFSGQRIALIVNEFGKTGVDGTLLRDLDVSLTEINNGSIFCTCQAGQFEKALQETAALAPDQIFVEASGLSDPTSIRALLSQPGLAQDLTYAGAICLLDAVRFHKVYKTARVCRMQLAVSDLILLNKADLATREQLDEIHAIVQVQKPGCPVYELPLAVSTPHGCKPWTSLPTRIPPPDSTPGISLCKNCFWRFPDLITPL